jgi:hypothetical protein
LSRRGRGGSKRRCNRLCGRGRRRTDDTSEAAVSAADDSPHGRTEDDQGRERPARQAMPARGGLIELTRQAASRESICKCAQDAGNGKPERSNDGGRGSGRIVGRSGIERGPTDADEIEDELDDQRCLSGASGSRPHVEAIRYEPAAASVEGCLRQSCSVKGPSLAHAAWSRQVESRASFQRLC